MLPVRVIKRVLHDLAEFEKNPIPGISLCMPDKNNPSVLHGNLVINQGIYKGILLHLIFRIPENYPLQPPQANLAPGLDFDQKYHHHVYEDQHSGNSICTDLTSNFAGAFNTKDSKGNFVQSGWTPGYTLSTLLTHLQIFFSDPDYGRGFTVSKQKLNILWNHIRDFKYDITVTDCENSETITHSYDSPYPSILGFKRIPAPKVVKSEEEECKSTDSPVISESTAEDLSPKSTEEKLPPKPKEPVTSIWDKPLKKVAKKLPTEQSAVKIQPSTKPVQIKKEEISNKLICSISKTNIFDSSEIILGYPIDMDLNKKTKQSFPTPVFEILSHEAHQANLEKNPQQPERRPSGASEKLQTGAGASYKYWLPLYLDDSHFERGKEHILSTITSIFKDTFDPEATEFVPFMILAVLPLLLSRMVRFSVEKAGSQTAVLIESYFQLFRLLIKLLDVFHELKETVEEDVDHFLKHDNCRHKESIPDLGTFLVKLAISTEGIDQSFDIVNLAFKEHLARQFGKAVQRDKGLIQGERCRDFVSRFMSTTKMANKVFLAQYETIKLCLDQKVQAELASNFGLIREEKAEYLVKKLKKCQQESVGNCKSLMERLGLQVYIPSSEVIQKYIGKAYTLARTQEYLK